MSSQSSLFQDVEQSLIARAMLARPVTLDQLGSQSAIARTEIAAEVLLPDDAIKPFPEDPFGPVPPDWRDPPPSGGRLWNPPSGPWPPPPEAPPIGPALPLDWIDPSDLSPTTNPPGFPGIPGVIVSWPLGTNCNVCARMRRTTNAFFPSMSHCETAKLTRKIAHINKPTGWPWPLPATLPEPVIEIGIEFGTTPLDAAEQSKVIPVVMALLEAWAKERAKGICSALPPCQRGNCVPTRVSLVDAREIAPAVPAETVGGLAPKVTAPGIGSPGRPPAWSKYTITFDICCGCRA